MNAGEVIAINLSAGEVVLANATFTKKWHYEVIVTDFYQIPVTGANITVYNLSDNSIVWTKLTGTNGRELIPLSEYRKFGWSASIWPNQSYFGNYSIQVTYPGETSLGDFYDVRTEHQSYGNLFWFPHLNAPKIIGGTNLRRVCNPNWECSDWSNCLNNFQQRNCLDSNYCGSVLDKPVESQKCSIEDEENVSKEYPVVVEELGCDEKPSNGEWSSCNGGLSTRESYYCSEITDYKWLSHSEEKSCNEFISSIASPFKSASTKTKSFVSKTIPNIVTKILPNIITKNIPELAKQVWDFLSFWN